MKYTRNIIKDPDTDELLLDLGDELCREAGWKVGDTLEWIDQGNGTWILRKVTLMNKWKNYARRLRTLISSPKT